MLFFPPLFFEPDEPDEPDKLDVIPTNKKLLILLLIRVQIN